MRRFFPRILEANVTPKPLVIVLAAVLVASVTVTVFAQTSLRCESTDGRRHECRLEGVATVQLSRQLSRNDCIEGETWGVNGNTLWVDGGCRANFTFSARDDRNGQGWDPRDANNGENHQWQNRTVTVLCESKDGRRHRCTADHVSHFSAGEVSLGRQISSRRNKCVEGRSWGYDSNSIWVDRGCRAEFLIVRNVAVHGDREPRHDSSTVTCESGSPDRTYCRADTSMGVQLMRELSRDRCEANRTWGADEHGIWVSDGCRAEFGLAARR